MTDEPSFSPRFLSGTDPLLCGAVLASVPRTAVGVPGRIQYQLASERGYPSRVVIDNGPEFRSEALDEWAYRHSVELVFIRPGKPIENCLIESFNASFRDECLNLRWFTSLSHARRTIQRWRQDYNHTWPHGALGGLAPAGGVCSQFGDALAQCTQGWWG